MKHHRLYGQTGPKIPYHGATVLQLTCMHMRLGMEKSACPCFCPPTSKPASSPGPLKRGEESKRPMCDKGASDCSVLAAPPTHYGIFGAGRGGHHGRTRTQQAGEGDPGPLVPKRGGRGDAAGNDPPRGFAPPARCEVARMRLATKLIMGHGSWSRLPPPPLLGGPGVGVDF